MKKTTEILLYVLATLLSCVGVYFLCCKLSGKMLWFDQIETVGDVGMLVYSILEALTISGVVCLWIRLTIDESNNDYWGNRRF